MAGVNPSQKDKLRKLGYSQSEINGMSEKTARQKIASGRVVSRTAREGGLASAPPEKTTSKDVKPYVHEGEVEGPARKPKAEGLVKPRPTLEGRLPATTDGTARKVATIAESALAEAGSKGGSIADDVAAFIGKHGVEGLGGFVKTVGGPLSAFLGTLADSSPAGEGEDTQLAALKAEWSKMTPEDRTQVLKAQIAQAEAPAQAEQSPSPAQPKRTGAAGMPMNPGESMAGAAVRHVGESIGDWLMGVQAKADAIQAERNAPKANPESLMAPPLSDPSAMQGEAAPQVAQQGPAQGQPMGNAPLPGRKPLVPPQPGPGPGQQAPQQPPRQTPPEENKLANPNNLGDMLEMMKRNGVETFSWQGKRFQAGDSPSGYHLVEEPQQGPGPGTGTLY